jgi:protein SCO1/2
VRSLLLNVLLGWSLLACGRPAELPHLAQVPDFSLRDQRDSPVSAKDLRGKIWIANFMFTSCPDVCPILTTKLSGVRTRLMGDRVKIEYVSFSVDPQTDTPAVLAKYAAEHHVDFRDWRFLTGPVGEIQQVVVGGFKQSLQRNPNAKAGSPESILHGSHFVLVDGALSIRGFYPSDEEGLLRIARDARILVRASQR